MTDAATLTDLKAAARTAAFARRKAAHAVRTPAAADSLCAELRRFAGRALAGYMPMRTEIDCLPAMAAHDGPVAVPVILGPGQPLRFRRWTPASRMVTGDFGALIPVTGDWIVPEVLVVPLVAFDRRGYRLGYGGGFYDRTLAAWPTVTAIGVAYDACEIESFVPAAHDRRLAAIVTETRTIVPGAA